MVLCWFEIELGVVWGVLGRFGVVWGGLGWFGVIQWTLLYLVINSAFIGTPGKASKIFLSKVLKTSTYKITLVIFQNKSSQF